MTPEQLQAVRAERWRQKSNPALTLDEATAWVNATGLCLFLPRRNQFLASAPSFVEACIGAPSDTPSRAEIDTARGLMLRLTESGAALPLNLFGAHTDQPDFLASRDAFPYIFSLRGGRNWKTPPPKATPLVVEIWKLLEPGASLEATEIQAALGREITESAVVRSLFDLWTGLRVMPVYTQDGPTRWEVTQTRFSDAMTAANKIAQTTGLSALVSLYLESVIAATPEEIETFLSPLTARSKARDVVNGLAATRQITIVPVGSQTMYHVAGSLPEFAEPEPVAERPKTEPKPAFDRQHSFREQRPPFERERPVQRRDDRTPERFPDRSQTGAPRRERFAARGGDRPPQNKPFRESERGERRPFRKFDEGKRPGRYSPGAEKSEGARRPFRKFEEGKRPERYSPGADKSGRERRPFRPRPFDDDAARPGGKFPPKKFGSGGERPPKKFGADRERPPKKFGADRERPPKKFGADRERPPRKFAGKPQKFGEKFRGKQPFFRERREGREESAPNRPTDPRRNESQDQRTGFPPRKGSWKPSRFAKSGAPKPGGSSRPEGSPFKGPRRERENQDGGRPGGGRPGGGRPGGGKFAGKKFGGPQSRSKTGGFKSGPRPSSAKPPFRKWKNKGTKDDDKNSE